MSTLTLSSRCAAGLSLLLAAPTLVQAQTEPCERGVVEAAAVARASTEPIANEAASLLPRPITSFGACRHGGVVYVYGGHIGRAHAHSCANVVGEFWCLDGGRWQQLPEGPALQGTALVAGPKGGLYRVGGMGALNQPGDDEELFSTASVARFDVVTGTWTEQTPLPEPRSSHDALVIGDWLYVVGGWQLAGGEEGDWLATAWRADLSHQPLEWQPLPAPTQLRRACALAARGQELVLLGGLGPDGMLNSVEVLSAAGLEWRAAPPLPGMAFGTAALGIGDTVYATVRDGRLCAWHGSDDWQAVAQLETPRFFHRVVAAGPDRVMVLGGAGRGDHTRSIETVALTARAAVPVVREFVLPAPGRVAYRQALVFDADTLWAFGGNRGDDSDRFAPDQFADDIWRIDLATLAATRAGTLPTGRQSMASVTWGGRMDNVLLGGLGLTAANGEVASLTGAYRWDVRRRELLPLAELPAPRTQCQVVHRQGHLLVLGGIDFVPDDGGGTSDGDPRVVLELDLAAVTARFEPSSLRLPRGRRSFGAAALGDELFLIGGLGEGFEPVECVDVHDFATGSWHELAAPVAWVSPQVATIGDRLYVACGGTMSGRRFREDRSLWSWSSGEGWRCVIAELPFPVRNVQMFARHNRLWFYAANDPRGDVIVLRSFEPDRDAHVPEAPAHR